MITAIAKLAAPLAVEVTLSVTMKISDWQALLTDINTLKSFPASQLGNAISNVVWKINTTATETIEALS